MGGTTFKVGIVREGLIEYQRESMVLRYHYALPKMDVVSLGLAGGSIISVDARTGTPRIGPRSAGSYPGPVCYGHGGEEPTITDVDAILGYLNPEFFLGGRAELDIDAGAAASSRRRSRGRSGWTLIEAAAAMYKLANSLFYDLLHKTTVQRGLDPRRFALFSFGGTAGHARRRVRRATSASPQIVIPHSASVHGAFGLVTSDIAHEDQITQPLRAPFDVAGDRGHLRRARGADRRAAARPRASTASEITAQPCGRHALPAPGPHPHGLRSSATSRDGRLAGADGRPLRAALRGEVRAAVRLPRGGHRARQLPRARHRRRQQARVPGGRARRRRIPQRRWSSGSRRGWTRRASSRRCRATTSIASALGTRYLARPSSGRRSRRWSSRPPRLRASTSIATSFSRWTVEDGRAQNPEQAVHPPARVNVTCVTPLGDEMASIS